MVRSHRALGLLLLAAVVAVHGQDQCTPVANSDAATLTCTTADDSQVTACAAGFNLCESGSVAACADGSTPHATADTCVPNPTCGNVDDDSDGGSEATDAFICPAGDILKLQPNTITCAAATCTAADCCDPSCGDMDDDGDNGIEIGDAFVVSNCETGLVLKSNLLAVGCPTGTCTSADCCEPPAAAPSTVTPAPAGTSAAAARVVAVSFAGLLLHALLW